MNKPTVIHKLEQLNIGLKRFTLQHQNYTEQWSQAFEVTAPRPDGRGFQLLRLLPVRDRTYASLHWQEPTVLRPVA
ncbi:MAG: hypothetical protein OIF57_00775, partial [Marinobacterium sp.]|nr:hypothetical protein [Marinobacterium sp.]